MNKIRYARRRASYEQYAHPSVKNYWSGVNQRPGDPHATHPLLSVHGDSLQKESYNYTNQRTTQKGIPENPRQNIQESMNTVRAVAEHEEAHKEELEAAAKQIVSKIYGISESKLYAELVRFGGVGTSIQAPPPEDTNLEEYADPQLEGEVHKRMTQNTLTHGAAVHGFMTAHHMADELLDSIDPNLKNMYDKLSSSSHKVYWHFNPQQIMQGGGTKAGEAYLDRDENGSIRVIARATTFPVLIQELIKGTLELLSLHGINTLESETRYNVKQIADHPLYEPQQIQVGPALWRNLIAILPKGIQLGKFMMVLNKMKPDQYHRFLEKVISEPEKAKIEAKLLVE